MNLYNLVWICLLILPAMAAALPFVLIPTGVLLLAAYPFAFVCFLSTYVMVCAFGSRLGLAGIKKGKFPGIPSILSTASEEYMDSAGRRSTTSVRYTGSS